MKLIKLLVMSVFLCFSFGLHAFAGQEENYCKTESSTQHCIFVCQAGCHTAETPVIVFSAPSYQEVVQPIFLTAFNYENPSLLGLKRPPIYLS